MKRILYLHGLESPQGGEKIDLLASTNFVCAPSIDYTRPDLESYLLGIVDSIKPDLIIGSSMGGYVGMMLAQYCSADVIVFNPALHSRSLEPKLPILLSQEGNHFSIAPIVVLGMEDHVIDPKVTVNMLDASELDVSYEIYPFLGHRIPNDVFIDIYNKYIK